MKLKTTRLKYSDRVVVISFILGLFALGTNAIAIIFNATQSIPAGNIFCILGALSLGPIGGLIAGALGIIPHGLMTGAYVDGFRFLLFLAGLGYCAKRWKEIPAFLIMGGFWLLTAPVTLLFFKQAPHQVALIAGAEILLTLVASTLLLHRGLWGSLTARPRHTEFKDILVYGAATILAFGYTTGCILFWSWHPLSFYSHATAFTLLGLTLITITVIVLRGLAQTLQENITNFIPRALAQNTFSGLSSTNWRRSQSGLTQNDGDFPDAADLAKEWNTVTNAKSRSATREAILAITGDNTISFVNRAFRSYLKEHDPDLLGKKLNEVPLPTEMNEALNDLVAAARSGLQKTVEIKMNCLPDRLCFLELHSSPGEKSPHASLQSGPGSVVITVKDISDRRTVESHLLQGQRVASLGSTIKGLAHSLNNYLTSISGHVSFARHAENQEQQSAALNEALEATREAGSLIRKLLEFAENKPDALRVMNLTALMHSQLDLISRLLGADIDLSVTVSERPVGTVCDPQMLTQALTNIVINAKEALPENGTRKIAISLEEESIHESVAAMIPGGRAGDFARITIKDSGSGMQQDVLARAFDPLFTTRQQQGHAGLGLSMVYAIVRAHDGFMSIETFPGKGTSVSVYLPINEWQGDQPDTRLALAGQEINKSTAETVLVVEDDPAVRDVVTQMLKTLGYTVTSCSNGPEALEICSTRTFDIALVDMMMPHMSGTELIQKIRSMTDKTKTLIMTGYGARSSDLTALKTLVIPKPFAIETLSTAIAQTLAAIENQESEAATSNSSVL